MSSKKKVEFTTSEELLPHKVYILNFDSDRE